MSMGKRTGKKEKGDLPVVKSGTFKNNLQMGKVPTGRVQCRMGSRSEDRGKGGGV